MLKNVFYRKTGDDFEFWFEFTEQILHHSTDGEFSIAEQIPGDAQEIPRTDAPQATGNLHCSILGGRLVGIYQDEPYTLKFDNGCAISVLFDYLYSDPTLGSYYTLEFYSAEHIAADSVLREYLDEVCVEANRMNISSIKKETSKEEAEICVEANRVNICSFEEKTSKEEAPAPLVPVSRMQRIRRFARLILAYLSSLTLLLLTYQIDAQAKPGWVFSEPICRFAAYLFHPGLPLLGTLCCFLFIHEDKSRYKIWLLPVFQTLAMSHGLAFILFLCSGPIRLASTMGDGAMALMFAGSLVTFPRMIPGILMYLILCCAGQDTRNAIRNFSEVLIYTILASALLWLGGMLIYEPFDFTFVSTPTPLPQAD